MILRTELTSYLHQLLACDSFNDYAPNGLQVQGREQIKSICTAVTASLCAIEEAIRLKADALLVHHGYFWKNESPTIIGYKRERIASILNNNISLLAYHLPLDCHEELGNNAMLAKKLNLIADEPTQIDQLIWKGKLSHAMSSKEFANHIQTVLGREPFYVSAGNKKIERVAWCTGAAQQFINDVDEVDAYLTGEVSEQTYHVALERGIHFYAAGHHATERYGIQALGEYIHKTFDIDCEFVDIDNPI